MASLAAVSRRAVHDQGVLRARRHAAVVGPGGAQGRHRRRGRDDGGAHARSRRHPARRHQRLRAVHVVRDATTASTAAPTTRTIRRASSVAARAARARSSAPAARPSASAATSAGRFACRRSSTACSDTSRPAGWCPARGSIRGARRGARMVATGPLARRAEDLWPLVKILAGPDGHDEGAHRMTLGDPAAVRLDKLTVVDVEDNGAQPGASRAQGGAGARRGDVLARRGRAHPTRALPRACAARSRSGRRRWRRATGQSFSELLGNGRRTRGARRAGSSGRCAARPHTLPAIGLAMLERVSGWRAARAARAVELGRGLRAPDPRRHRRRRDALPVVRVAGAAPLQAAAGRRSTSCTPRSST